MDDLSGRTEANGASKSTLQHKRIVFLIGVPRSGTTWLQLLLAQSHLVVTAQETHLFAYLQSFFDRWESRLRHTGEPGLHHIFDESEFLDFMRGIADRVLAQIAKKNPSATLILEKSPVHLRYWRSILKLYPDACFIHIIRDPRAVVASLVAASGSWASHWASSDIATNCAIWVSDVTQGRQIATATPNYIEIGYRDLILDGPATLLRIFNSLGIDANSEQCRRYIENCEIGNLQAGRFPPVNIGGQSSALPLREVFRVGKIDRWKEELSPTDVALIEHMTEPLFSDLGFEITSAWGLRYLAPLMPNRLAKTAATKVAQGLVWRLRRILDRLHGQ